MERTREAQERVETRVKQNLCLYIDEHGQECTKEQTHCGRCAQHYLVIRNIAKRLPRTKKRRLLALACEQGTLLQPNEIRNYRQRSPDLALLDQID